MESILETNGTGQTYQNVLRFSFYGRGTGTTQEVCLLSGAAHDDIRILRELGMPADIVANVDDKVFWTQGAYSWETFKNLFRSGCLLLRQIVLQDRFYDDRSPSTLFDGRMSFGRTVPFYPDWTFVYFKDYVLPTNYDRTKITIGFPEYFKKEFPFPIGFLSMTVPGDAVFSITFVCDPLLKS